MNYHQNYNNAKQDLRTHSENCAKLQGLLILLAAIRIRHLWRRFLRFAALASVTVPLVLCAELCGVCGWLLVLQLLSKVQSIGVALVSNEMSCRQNESSYQ